MGASGHDRGGAHLEHGQSGQVVAVGGLAVEEVEAPAGEGPTLGDDHALQTGGGRDDLGRDREGLVLDADHAVLREAAHAGEELLRLPPDERWSPR